MRNKNSNNKILFIAYYYLPATGVAGAQRIIKLIRYLRKVESYVLTLSPEHYPEEHRVKHPDLKIIVSKERIYRTNVFDFFGLVFKLKGLVFNGFANKSKRRDECFESTTLITPESNVNIYKHVKDFVSCILSYPDFERSWFIPALLRGLRIIKAKNIDIIFTTGMPWTSLLIGAILKTFTRKKLIVDFRDPWVNNPFVLKNSSLEEYLDAKCEEFVIRKADLVILNTKTLKTEMESRYSNFKHKMISLPNGYDSSNFKSLPNVTLPKEQFTISHGGFLYLKRDPISILNSIEYIKKKCPSLGSMIRFYQIGPVTLGYNMDEVCRKKQIEKNVILFNKMNHQDCLGYLAASDMLLILQPGTKVQIPSKLYEYIYFGKPILTITVKGGELWRFITEYGFGEVFEPNEHAKIADYIMGLMKEKETYGIVRRNYSKKTDFDIRKVIKRLEERLGNL